MAIGLNLVPENLRKRRKSGFAPIKGFQLPREVVIGLVGGLLALLVFIHVLLQLVIIVQYVQLYRYQGTQKGLSAKEIEANQVLQQLRKLQASLQLVDDLSSRRSVYWAPKINAISDSMSRGVWLEKLELEGKKFTLTGSAVSKTASEMIEVNNFTSKLKSNATFSRDFAKVDPGSIKTRKVNSTAVADFTVTAMLK